MVLYAGAGPVPVRTPNGIIMSYACVFAIRVADGHGARPCTLLSVDFLLHHLLHGFSASLFYYHLAWLSLADALA